MERLKRLRPQSTQDSVTAEDDDSESEDPPAQEAPGFHFTFIIHSL